MTSSKPLKVVTIAIGLVSLAFITSYQIQYFISIKWFKFFGLFGLLFYAIFIILSIIVLPCMDNKPQEVN